MLGALLRGWLLRHWNAFEDLNGARECCLVLERGEMLVAGVGWSVSSRLLKFESSLGLQM